MKGILFKPEMIKAIVKGRKTQTRRVIKPQPIVAENYKGITIEDLEFDGFKPHYHVGEVAYIKEVFYEQEEIWADDHFEPSGSIFYKTDYQGVVGGISWQSSLCMPARIARYFIQITDAKPQRLQEITEEDAEKEGLISQRIYDCGTCRLKFKLLWDSINPRYPWESNPWVFVYSFKLVEKEA